MLRCESLLTKRSLLFMLEKDVRSKVGGAFVGTDASQYCSWDNDDAGGDEDGDMEEALYSRCCPLHMLSTGFTKKGGFEF
jgi:hypothetical protein